MASGPITLWQIDGETVETLANFIFGGSKSTADGDCSREMKICLILGRKAMTNLDSVFESRDITLPTEVHLVKAMVFPVVMYGCESWTVKKAECTGPPAPTPAAAGVRGRSKAGRNLAYSTDLTHPIPANKRVREGRSPQHMGGGGQSSP